jgi:ABC-2 type transport system permease protein
MRLFSEERRTRTLDLLLSAPVGAPAIVLGKYLGVLALLLSLVVLVGLLPLSLAIGATLDYGKLLAGMLGLSLLAASAAAAGLYISTLTTQPVAAATVTLGLLLALEVVDAAGNLFRYLSLLRHYDALLLGLVNSADIAYYLLFATAFLGLAIRRLDDIRLRD